MEKEVSVFFFWLRCVFVAACRLSLVVVSGAYSSLWCVGFSLRWLLLLWSTGSRRVGFRSCSTRASGVAVRGLSSCGVWAQQLWLTGLATPRHVDLPRPGLKPMFPALAGRFLTTAPPGKSPICIFKIKITLPFNFSSN